MKHDVATGRLLCWLNVKLLTILKSLRGWQYVLKCCLWWCPSCNGELNKNRFTVENSRIYWEKESKQLVTFKDADNAGNPCRPHWYYSRYFLSCTLPSAVRPDRRVSWHHLSSTASLCFALFCLCRDKGLASNKELTPEFHTRTEEMLLVRTEKECTNQGITKLRFFFKWKRRNNWFFGLLLILTNEKDVQGDLVVYSSSRGNWDKSSTWKGVSELRNVREQLTCSC